MKVHAALGRTVDLFVPVGLFLAQRDHAEMTEILVSL